MSLLIRKLILSAQGPTAMISFKHNYFLTPHIAKLGVRTSTYEQGDTNIQFIAVKRPMGVFYFIHLPFKILEVLRILLTKEPQKSGPMRIHRLAQGFIANLLFFPAQIHVS